MSVVRMENPSIVALLERMLADAERGEITGLVGCATLATGETARFESLSDATPYMLLFAELSSTAVHFATHRIECCPENGS